MGRRAEKLIQALWDTEKADQLFANAVAAVDMATGNNFDRDHVRTVGVTNAIIAQYRS